MTSTTAYAIVKGSNGSETRWFSGHAAGIHETVANWIRKRFKAQIEDVYLSGLVAYDNAPAADPAGAMHASLRVLYTGTETVGLAITGQYRIGGEIEVTVRSPLTQGDVDARELCDQITAAFREEEIPVDVRVLSPSIAAASRSLGWHELTLVLPFFYIDRAIRATTVVGAHTGTWEALANTIRDRFDTQVATAHSLSVAYDNSPHTPAEGVRWARWSIIQGSTEGSEMNNVFRTQGLGIAQVFVPLGQGDAAALEVIDTTYESFRGTTTTGVQFGIPSAQSVGRTEGWWQVNVSCPFTSYQHD